MGCDIHAHMEIKTGGIWYHLSPVDLQRNYATFSRMAGVRNSQGIVPISEPKGLPVDIAVVTKMHSDAYAEYGHSHSWLGFDEMTQLLAFWSKRKEKPWGEFELDSSRKHNDFGVWLFGYGIGSFGQYPEEYPDRLEDVRIVFWFDN